MSRRRYALPLMAALLYLFLYAPIGVVVLQSFNSAKRGAAWQGFTTHWYTTLMESPEKLLAVRNTLVLGIASTAVSTLLGTLLGYGLARHAFAGRRLVTWWLYLPVMIPDIVLAVAMLMFYSAVRDWLGLFQLGMPSMILAHITFQIPFVALVIRSRLAGIDPALDEAARDLGASSLQRFRYVTLPLLAPGILAAAALAFTLSIDDFIVSFFTTGPGASTLPILIYSSVKRGVTPDIHALSTLIILVSILGTLTVTHFQRRSQT